MILKLDGDIILKGWSLFFLSIHEYSKDTILLLTKSMLNNLSSDTRPVIILQTMCIDTPSKISWAMSRGKQSTTWKYLRELRHDLCLIL